MSSLGINGALYLAANSLTAQRQAIEVTGQNISNVNTPNYARQRAQLITADPLKTTLGQEGTGALVNTIVQIRSSLIDSQLPPGLSTFAYHDEKMNLMSQLQANLEQPLDRLNALTSTTPTSGQQGLAEYIDNFFNSFQALNADPTSNVLRQQVILKSQALAAKLNTIGTALETIQVQVQNTVTSAVDEVNTALTNIATINSQIIPIELGGLGRANDLRDKRQQLLEDLSKKIDVYSHEESDGSLTVRLGSSGGTLLVSGVFSGNTASSTTVKLAVDGTAPTMTIKSWTGGEAETSGNLDSVSSQPAGGSIGAQLDVVNDVIGDGTTGLIRDYNRIAQGLAELVNAKHQTGYTLQGSPNYNTAGTATFFDDNSVAADALGTITARNIQLNSAVAGDVAKIAASDATGQPLNGNMAASISNLRTNTTATNLGGLTVSQYYLATLTDLAGDVQAAQTQADTQQLVNKQLLQQRDAVQGVSLDEETTDLMRFQHAYEASARLLTVIDEMMKTLLQAAG